MDRILDLIGILFILALLLYGAWVAPRVRYVLGVLGGLADHLKMDSGIWEVTMKAAVIRKAGGRVELEDRGRPAPVPLQDLAGAFGEMDKGHMRGRAVVVMQ